MVLEDSGEKMTLDSIATSDQEKVKRIITLFTEHVGKRPGVFILKVEPEYLWTFLIGFHMATYTVGLNNNLQPFYEKVAWERGRWALSARAPYEVMRESGLNDAEIIQEMIAIEIEAWKRAYNIAD